MPPNLCVLLQRSKLAVTTIRTVGVYPLYKPESRPAPPLFADYPPLRNLGGRSAGRTRKPQLARPSLLRRTRCSQTIPPISECGPPTVLAGRGSALAWRRISLRPWRAQCASSCPRASFTNAKRATATASTAGAAFTLATALSAASQ